jgi:hypothetical protein
MGEKLIAHIEAIGGAMSTTEMLRGRTIGKVVSTVTKSLRVVKNIQPSKIHAENSVHGCYYFHAHQVLYYGRCLMHLCRGSNFGRQAVTTVCL